MSAVDTFRATDSTVVRDFFGLICGDRLGYGHGREVFAVKFDPNLVVKFEERDRSFQNVLEWQFWLANENRKEVRKWIAPCVQISSCGTSLIQARTTPIKDLALLPKRIPWWAADTKVENWGMYEGRPVMHDYAYTNALDVTSKLEPAVWWRDV